METMTEVETDSFVTIESPSEAELPELPFEEPALTEEETDRIHEAFNYWHMHGFPEKAAVLTECLKQGRRPPANLVLINETDIKPEIPLASYEGLEIPPRAGPDATAEAWRAFAAKVTDMEPEIIAKMGRPDLISMLEVKKIIPTVESKPQSKKTTKTRSKSRSAT